MSTGLNELLEDLQEQLEELQASRRTYEDELKKSGKLADVTLTRMLSLEFQISKSIERVTTQIAKLTPAAPIQDDDGDSELDDRCSKDPILMKEIEEAMMRSIEREANSGTVIEEY